MSAVPLLLIDGDNLLFRACFGTPAQIWSRDPDDKRDLTTEFMFFALLRKGINSELPGWPAHDEATEPEEAVDTPEQPQLRKVSGGFDWIEDR